MEEIYLMTSSLVVVMTTYAIKNMEGKKCLKKKGGKDHASRNEARPLTCICLTAAHIHGTILHHLCTPKLQVLEASIHQQLTL
jgi:hypothetical protein